MESNIKAVTESMMASLMKSPDFVGVDGADRHPTLDGDDKATFTMNRVVYPTGIDASVEFVPPTGEWLYKVTIEATFTKIGE